MKPKLVLLEPVVFACIESLPTTVFVEILPPPLPMLIEFTEISFATNNWLLRETSPSRDNAPTTVISPPTFKSPLKEASPPSVNVLSITVAPETSNVELMAVVVIVVSPTTSNVVSSVTA